MSRKPCHMCEPTRCRCDERFAPVPEIRSVPEAPAQGESYTYASKQATMCAECGEHKHTPLRIDAMGGYVCLTCIDRKLGSMLGEFGYPEAPAQGGDLDALLNRFAQACAFGDDQPKRIEAAKAIKDLFTRSVLEAQAIPAPWREAVKVAREREAFESWMFDTERRQPTTWDAECAKMGSTVPAHKVGHYYLREDQIRWEAWCAALAQLDALEGGE